MSTITENFRDSRLIHFMEKFESDAHMILAAHASFTEAITPDLLYKLWLNFQFDEDKEKLNIPLWAVADLLSSSICRKIGVEIFEIYPKIRAELRNHLLSEPNFGIEREKAIAEFIQSYLDLCRDKIPNQIFYKALDFSSLSIIDPGKAVERVLNTLKDKKLSSSEKISKANVELNWIHLPSTPNSKGTSLKTIKEIVKGLHDYNKGKRADAIGTLSSLKDNFSQLPTDIKDGINVGVSEQLLVDLDLFREENQETDSEFRKEKLIPYPHSKVVFLGDPGVGKTTLVESLFGNKTFFEGQPTRGINISKHTYTFADEEGQSKNYSIEVYDFGGQTVYRDVINLFSPKNAIYIIVVDNESDDRFYHWAEIQNKVAKDSPSILIYNIKKTIEKSPLDILRPKSFLKIDLSNTQMVIDARQSIHSKIESFASKNKIPEQYGRFYKLLKKRASIKSFLHLDEIHELSLQFNLKNRISDFLKLFHLTGDILHFPDSSHIADIVFINPALAIDFAISLFNSKKLKNSNGLVSTSNFVESFKPDEFTSDWNDKFEANSKVMFKLLEHFELIYEFGSDFILIPEYFRNSPSKNYYNFFDIYVKSFVSYSQKNKPKFLKNFYQTQAVIDALKIHWYSEKAANPFYESLENLAYHFALQKQLGKSSTEEKEISEYEETFRKIAKNHAFIEQKKAFNDIQNIKERLQNAKPKAVPKELTLINRTNSHNLIGRTEDLQHLRQLLSEEKKITLLNGMGGSGKTTLAEAYIFENYDAYDHIAWITNNSKTLSSDFIKNRELLIHLDLHNTELEPHMLFEEIMRRMKNFPTKNNLLIIDNAVKSAVTPFLHKLPSPPNWHLLVTSRERIPGMAQKNLSYLNPEEANALFKKHCQLIKDEAFIDEITAAVEYHILTIEILAKTTARMYLTPEQVRNALKTDAKTDIDDVKRSEGKTIRRITTYLSSIFNFSELESDEIWLLKQLACLPLNFFELSFLREVIKPNKGKATNFINNLNNLADKGWLLKSGDLKSVKMHKIIQQVVQTKIRITHNDIAALLDNVTKHLYFDPKRDNPLEKFQWIPFGNSIYEAVKLNLNPNVAALETNLALVLIEAGNLKRALLLLEKALHINKKSYRHNSLVTSKSHLNFGIVNRLLGNYRKAINSIQIAIQIDSEHFKSKTSNLSIAYSNLGLVYRDMKEYDNAVQNIKKGIEIQERIFGKNHPSTNQSYMYLGSVYIEQRQLAKAKDLIEKAVVNFKKNFGVEHPFTEQCYSYLETISKGLDNLKEAKVLPKKNTLKQKKSVEKIKTNRAKNLLKNSSRLTNHTLSALLTEYNLSTGTIEEGQKLIRVLGEWSVLLQAKEEINYVLLKSMAEFFAIFYRNFLVKTKSNSVQSQIREIRALIFSLIEDLERKKVSTQFYVRFFDLSEAVLRLSKSLREMGY